MADELLRVVVDTNVVFEGLTKRGSACGLIIDAWEARLFQACTSTALAYEYEDVLSRKLSPARWRNAQPMLAALLAQAEPVTLYFSWRPASPDPGDDLVIDCAMNAGALVVTANVSDFRAAEKALDLTVLSPTQLAAQLATED